MVLRFMYDTPTKNPKGTIQPKTVGVGRLEFGILCSVLQIPTLALIRKQLGSCLWDIYEK